MTSEEPFVPGNSEVRKGQLNPSEYFCSKCSEYVTPLVIRVGENNYPACEDCFLDDLKNNPKYKLGDPLDTGEEIEDELVGEVELEQEDEITEEIVTGE